MIGIGRRVIYAIILGLIQSPSGPVQELQGKLWSVHLESRQIIVVHEPLNSYKRLNPTESFIVQLDKDVFICAKNKQSWRVTLEELQDMSLTRNSVNLIIRYSDIGYRGLSAKEVIIDTKD